MHITSLETFEELHCLIYCAAVAILRTIRARIVSSIAELGKNIERLTQYKNGIRSRKVMDTARQFFNFSKNLLKYKFVDNFLDALKQKLSL
jgi:hypothetical protein